MLLLIVLCWMNTQEKGFSAYEKKLLVDKKRRSRNMTKGKKSMSLLVNLDQDDDTNITKSTFEKIGLCNRDFKYF